MRGDLALIGSFSLMLGGSITCANADAVPPAILWQVPQSSTACGVQHMGQSDEARCTLLRDHPTSLCFAVATPNLGCPSTENLRPCPELANVPGKTSGREAAAQDQCALRRSSVHFASLEIPLSLR